MRRNLVLGGVVGAGMAIALVGACVGDSATTGPAQGTDSGTGADGSTGTGDGGGTTPLDSGGGAQDGGDAACVVPGGAFLSDAVQVSVGGGHACALRASGAVVCWGDNTLGQLGVAPNTTPTSNVPVTVASFPAGTTILSVYASDSVSFAIDSTHSLWAWGSNEAGLLGNGTVDSNPHFQAAQVTMGGSPLVALSLAVSTSACVINGAGKVVCWGTTAFGAITPGAIDAGIAAPTLAFANTFGTTSTLVTGIGATAQCVLDSTKTAPECWGLAPQTGDWSTPFGKASVASSAQLVPALQDGGVTVPLSQLVMGTNFSCALDATGQATCNGNNSSDQLTPAGYALNTNHAGFAKLTGIGTPTALSPGYVHICALESDQSVLCWGHNQFQELGRGDTFDAGSSGTPASVIGPDGGTLGSVAKLSSGLFETCALLTGACGASAGGAVLCWGNNDHGQLGRGTTDILSGTPRLVAKPL